jgi:hypothetical protein
VRLALDLEDGRTRETRRLVALIDQDRGAREGTGHGGLRVALGVYGELDRAGELVDDRCLAKDRGRELRAVDQLDLDRGSDLHRGSVTLGNVQLQLEDA